MARFVAGNMGHITEHNRVDSMVYDVRQYGAVGNGTTDDAPAFQAALDAITAASTNGNNRGATLFVPSGVWRMAATIRVERCVIITGVSGSGWGAGSLLQFDDGVTGIRIDHPTTSLNGGYGQWSTISNLGISAAAKTVADADGIVMYARASVRDVYVNGFSGRGVAVLGGAGRGPNGEGTNANSWSLQNMRINGCGSHGVYVAGGDSNAGIAINVDASANGGWGIYDSSFLGNTWVACHVEANTLGAYKADSNAGLCTFVGCYSEGGQPASEMVAPSVWIGGIPGAGFAAGTTAGTVGGGTSGFRFKADQQTDTMLEGLAFTDVRRRWSMRTNGRLSWHDGVTAGQTTAYIDPTGLVLRSPDGTQYRLAPPDGGGAATWVAV